MKSVLKKFIVTSILVVVCLSTSVQAKTDCDFKVGVIDTAKVINKSIKYKELEKERTKNLQALSRWVETAKTDIAKQQTPEARTKLAKKYNEDFERKKVFVRRNFETQINDINEYSLNLIDDYAQTKQYAMVFEKSSVLYGGKNITGPIIRRLNWFDPFPEKKSKTQL